MNKQKKLTFDQVFIRVVFPSAGTIIVKKSWLLLMLTAEIDACNIAGVCVKRTGRFFTFTLSSGEWMWVELTQAAENDIISAFNLDGEQKNNYSNCVPNNKRN